MEGTFWQKVEGTTDQILNEIKRLVEAGNIRRVVVKQRGRTVAEFPLTALVADCTIEVGKTAPDIEPAAEVTVPSRGRPGPRPGRAPFGLLRSWESCYIYRI